MNRLSPLTLPRFDVKALSRTAQSRESHTEVPDGQSDYAPEPVAASVEAEAEALAAPDLQAPVIPEPDPVDTGVLLASLEASLTEMEAAAMSIYRKTLSDFLMSAFPRLNEAFLAAEITAALETMAPPHVERLNLKIPSTLEASFRHSLQHSQRLAEICELHPSEAPDQMRVEIDWRDGGLLFDMDKFLNSSLGRLSGL